MKQLATIGGVVLILLAAALYFGSQKKADGQPDSRSDRGRHHP